MLFCFVCFSVLVPFYFLFLFLLSVLEKANLANLANSVYPNLYYGMILT